MVVSNKDAIFNDDASWTKTNVCLSVVLKKYKLNDNESTILRIIIDVYNRAVLTFQKSEKKKETSISYDGLAEIMGVTKRTVYNAIQSLLDKGLIIRINKEVITTKDKSLDNGTKDKSLDNGTGEIRKGRDKSRYVPNSKKIKKDLDDLLDNYPQLADWGLM